MNDNNYDICNGIFNCVGIQSLPNLKTMLFYIDLLYKIL